MRDVTDKKILNAIGRLEQVSNDLLKDHDINNKEWLEIQKGLDRLGLCLLKADKKYDKKHKETPKERWKRVAYA